MPDSTHLPYRGRFAPSPTGPLHLGSLIAALASYLDARRHGGTWLVRMENLDPPREEPGADRLILHTLQQHGLHWDEDVLWQGQRDPAYNLALTDLDHNGLLFHCDCSRAMLGAGGACNGRCRPRQNLVHPPCSTRIAIATEHGVHFKDQLQGQIDTALGRVLPDFVVRRKDALIAYQLAVVVDDAFQNITHIVRGSDLLDSTAKQIYLQQMLGYQTPHYQHLPVITDSEGQKFSKQSHAPALDDSQPGNNLRTALQFLRQTQPPPEINDVPALLRFAIAQWEPLAIPPVMAITADSCMP